MMIPSEAHFIIRNVLVASIMLSSPANKCIPVLANPGLSPRTWIALPVWRCRYEKVVRVAHGILTHVVNAVHNVLNFARERSPVVRIVYDAMNYLLWMIVSDCDWRALVEAYQAVNAMEGIYHIKSFVGVPRKWLGFG